MQFDPEAFPVPDLGLRCLACQYHLVGLMVHRCPECGRPFTLDEHIPPGDWPMLIVDGENLRATPDVLAVLKAAQIPIYPVSTSGTAPHGLSGDYAAPSHIFVARSAYWDAVHEFARRARGESTVNAVEIDGIEWNCAHCGESNPGNFEVCWQCSGERQS